MVLKACQFDNAPPTMAFHNRYPKKGIYSRQWYTISPPQWPNISAPLTCRAASWRFRPGRFREVPCPRPRRPVRSWPTPDAARRGCWRRWPLTRGSIHGTSAHLPLAPRFWHGRVMLRWAEFRLCSNSSLSGRVGQQAVPGCGAAVHTAHRR